MSNADYDQVERILERCRAGDRAATDDLWRLYFQRISAFARSKLPRQHRRIQDDEDVAIVVLNTLFSGLEQGAFDTVKGDDDLWPILLTMTQRVASNVRRAAMRDPTCGISPTRKAADIRPNEVISMEQQPVDAAALREALSVFLGKLGARQRCVIQLRISGSSLDEIADEIGLSRRSVTRILHEIRTHEAISYFDFTTQNEE